MLRNLYAYIKNRAGQGIQVFLEYVVLSILVFFPIFKKGRIMLLDYSSVPHMSLAKMVATNENLIGGYLSWILNQEILSKLVFVFSFALLGFGMHRLVALSTKNNIWAAYFAGLLAIFNPWIYSRILYGQTIVFSLVVVPWFVLVLVNIFSNEIPVNQIDTLRSRFVRFLVFCRSPLMLAVLGTVMVAMMAQSIFFIVLILGVFVSVYGFARLVSRRSGLLKDAMAISLKIALFVLFFGALNISWLAPIASGQSHLTQVVTSAISQRDFYEFKTVSDTSHGLILNTAALYGFWADQEMRYMPLKSIVPYWIVLYGGILFCAFWGIGISVIRGFKRIDGRSWISFAWAVVGVISLILGVGIAHRITAPISWWLYEHVFFYRGFREPQKWVALLVVVYAYLGGVGVADLIPRLQSLLRHVQIRIDVKKHFLVVRKILISVLLVLQTATPVIFLLAPLLYGQGMLGGFRGQLCVSEYPNSWFTVDDFLKKDDGSYQVLFLPWHQYLSLSFACGQVVNNPAERFFSKKIIAGDNMEMGSHYTSSTRPDSKYIEQEILANRERFYSSQAQRPTESGLSVKSLGTALLPLQVKYVIVAQESDYFDYGFVARSPDMVPVYSSPEIMVYKNLQWSDL